MFAFPFFNSVRNRSLFDMKANLRFGGCRRRAKERLELAPDESQHVIVFEEFGIHLSETLEHIGLGQHDFTLFDERADDINAHFDSLRAVEDISRHQGTVLGEGFGQGTRITMPLGTGHKS